MLTYSLGSQIIDLVDHALAAHYASLHLNTGRDDVEPNQGVLSYESLDGCIATSQNSLRLLGSILSEAQELYPYLDDRELRKRTYEHLATLIGPAPRLALKQAHVVRSVRHGWGHGVQLRSGATGGGTAPFLQTFKTAREQKLHHAELVMMLNQGLNSSADSVVNQIFRLETSIGLDLDGLHSSWLQWVARLKMVSLSIGHQYEQHGDVRRLGVLLNTLLKQQRQINYSLDQALAWRSSIDIEDLPRMPMVASVH